MKSTIIIICLLMASLAQAAYVERTISETEVDENQEVHVTLTAMDTTGSYFAIVRDNIPQGWTYVSGGSLEGNQVKGILSDIMSNSMTYVLRAPPQPGAFLITGTYQFTNEDAVSTPGDQRVTVGCVEGPEICDGIDNNCNGDIDEGQGVLTCGQGVCVQTVQSCEQGIPQTCDPFQGASEEVCDAAELDEDCDGTPNEGCDCTNGQTRSCGINTGECQIGYNSCVNGQWDNICVGEVTPSEEVCDGLDNNCDGTPDEGLGTTTCGLGACEHTVDNCRYGDPVTCDPMEGAGQEICDQQGNDEDCDGSPNEGCSCSTSDTKTCGTNLGECSEGYNVCDTAGQWSAECFEGQGPVEEVCDGLDNNCDGLLDNGNGPEFSTETCGLGECLHTVNLCQDGAPQTCNPMEGASEEICDGLDNDCDGNPDEGCECSQGDTRSCGQDLGECQSGENICENGRWSSACYGAITPSDEVCDGLNNDCDDETDEGFSTATCGLGECLHTINMCQDGQLQTCDPMLGAVEEICDGLDNDCDGQPDEGCICTDGDQRACGSDVGQCQEGTEICIGGQWSGECTGGVSPAEEICDGVDNDCDTFADEEMGTSTCGQGACLNTVQNCVNGELQECDPMFGAVDEVCEGAIDENCDGNIDEGCECNAADTRACGNNVGECEAGIESCSAGQWNGECVGEVTETPEVCDGLDNNCDGQADENLGETKCGVGQCLHTVHNCLDGVPQSCNPTEGATVEICDGIDNDCDTTIDEGCECTEGDVRSCGKTSIGECQEGKEYCRGGQWTGQCVGAVGPSDEVCDGKDNDCDGTTDNDLGQTTCGEGRCKQTVDNCVYGKEQSCDPFAKAKRERCDGKDNDCDGTVDEGCECRERWKCTRWSSCEDGYRTRECTDLNECGTEKRQPREEWKCVSREKFWKRWNDSFRKFFIPRWRQRYNDRDDD